MQQDRHGFLSQFEFIELKSAFDTPSWFQSAFAAFLWSAVVRWSNPKQHRQDGGDRVKSRKQQAADRRVEGPSLPFLPKSSRRLVRLETLPGARRVSVCPDRCPGSLGDSAGCRWAAAAAGAERRGALGRRPVSGGGGGRGGRAVTGRAHGHREGARPQPGRLRTRCPGRERTPARCSRPLCPAGPCRWELLGSGFAHAEPSVLGSNGITLTNGCFVAYASGVSFPWCALCSNALFTDCWLTSPYSCECRVCRAKLASSSLRYRLAGFQCQISTDLVRSLNQFF